MLIQGYAPGGYGYENKISVVINYATFVGGAGILITLIDGLAVVLKWFDGSFLLERFMLSLDGLAAILLFAGGLVSQLHVHHCF